jgi:anti-sigma factor RsiW
VRCSSCEPLLDEFIEHLLPDRAMHAVGAHVDACAACASLLAELRSVDALLETTRPAALSPNFTFAIMAEVRSLPAPRQRSIPFWAILAAYLVGAWIAASAAIVVAGGTHLSLHAVTYQATHVGGLQAIAGLLRAIGPISPVVGIGVTFVLLADMALLAGIVVFYRNLRGRVAARAPAGPTP